MRDGRLSWQRTADHLAAVCPTVCPRASDPATVPCHCEKTPPCGHCGGRRRVAGIRGKRRATLTKITLATMMQVAVTMMLPTLPTLPTLPLLPVVVRHSLLSSMTSCCLPSVCLACSTEEHAPRAVGER